jgi:hypothetical protein
VTVVTVDEQQGRQGDGVAGCALDLVDEQHVADGDLLLATASAHNRVHVVLSSISRGHALSGTVT